MRVKKDQFQKLYTRLGSEVEVRRGSELVWYKAIIEEVGQKCKGCIGLCVRLLKDGSKNPLPYRHDWIRPVPPTHLQARVDIKEGCVVDADCCNGWWSGIVIKEIEGDDKFLVFFESPPDIVEFQRKHLRPHLDWICYKYWVEPSRERQLLRRLTEESIFSSGTMVEVSSKISKMQTGWASAMIIKEIEEDDVEKCIVKFCDKPSSCKGSKANVTVDLKSVRPTPPPSLVEEYKLSESVEAFRGSKWCKGVVRRIVSEKLYMVYLEATKKEMKFKHSDLRPLMEWEDGVWKTRDSPLAKGSGDKMDGSAMNGNETVLPREAETQGQASPKKTRQSTRNRNGLGNDSTQEKGKPEKETHSNGKTNESVTLETSNAQTKELPLAQGLGIKMTNSVMKANDFVLPATPSPVINARPLKQTVTETQGKTIPTETPQPVKNQNGLANGLTRENAKKSSEDNVRKRKREETVSSVASVEENKVKDTTIILPFEKKLPIWKTLESMEVFKTIPQSPHFSPLFDTRESSREMSAVGMMLTFSGLIEEVKHLQLFTPNNTLESLNGSFVELEKHGFDVKAPQSRIHKLLSLRDGQAKKMEELQGVETKIGEKESKKVEIEQKIIMLQREKEEAEEEIAQMKSRAIEIGQELEDMEIQFQTTVSAHW